MDESNDATASNGGRQREEKGIFGTLQAAARFHVFRNVQEAARDAILWNRMRNDRYSLM